MARRDAGRRFAARWIFTLLLWPGAAAAGTHWRCELTSDLVRLACRAEVAPVDAALVAPVPVTVNGTRFPLDASRRWFVELWTPPSDAQWLELLARATICFRSPGCTVEVIDASQLAAR